MLSKQPISGNTPVTFRRFSRKGYSLFACLGREVRIGVLSVATLGGAAPCLAVQTHRPFDVRDSLSSVASDDEVRFDEAVVSASRAPLTAALSARPVMTLTRRDLAAAGVTSINDALKLAAGIDVRQRGSFGIQTDISINGGSFDGIAILINGISITNPQTGHNAADFPIQLSDVERIEILEGAASRVFGSQAFSGAVNVVTRRGGPSLDVRLSGGSYGTATASARTVFRLRKGMATSLSAGYQRSDGAVRNGDFESLKSWWQGHYSAEDFRVDAQAGVSVNDFGANTFYSAAYPDQWEATRRYLVSLRGETRGRLRFAPSLSWLRSTDHYQLIRHSEKGENFHRGDVFTLGVNAWTDWKAGRTAFGAEMRDEGIFSTSLGHLLPEGDRFPVPGGHGVYYTRRDHRNHLNAYLEHNAVLGPLNVSAGVMAWRGSGRGRGFRLYPGVDVSYRPTAAWRVFASWNRSMRLPTFTDLWYKSPTLEGNTNLEPEESSAFRLGATYRGPGVEAGTDAFFQRGNGMIDWVMYAPDDIYHATSFRLDGYGVSAHLRADLSVLLGTRQPLTALTMDYAWMHRHRRDGEDFYKSNYAMEYLRHKFVVRLDHRIWSALSASWTMRFRHRVGSYLEYADARPTGTLRPYGRHALIDAKLAWTATRYTLTLEAANLTDHRYFDLANVRQPGFTLMAGVALRPFGR